MSANPATVLVLTAAEDPTADAVVAELKRRAARVVRLDLGDFPGRLRLAAQSAEFGWFGRLWADDVVVDLTDVRSVYYRRPRQFRFPAGLSDGDLVFAAGAPIAAALADLLIDGRQDDRFGTPRSPTRRHLGRG
jgi:hypothetical protein